MSFADLLLRTDRRVNASIGDTVVYTSGAGTARTVSGVFDALHQRVDVGEPGVTSTGPAVSLRLEDLPSDPSTDTDAQVSVAGVQYTIHETQPDGKGWIVCLLHHA